MGRWPRRRADGPTLSEESPRKRRCLAAACGGGEPKPTTTCDSLRATAGQASRPDAAAGTWARRGGTRPLRHRGAKTTASSKKPPGEKVVGRRLGEVDEMVGPVTETREEHLRRHAGGWRGCPRCRWYLFGHRWQATYGSVDAALRVGPRDRVVWIAERPQRWGGAWALGCTLCSDSLARRRLKDSPDVSAGAGHARRLSGGWARFDVRPSTLQAEHLRQHAHSDVHKVAMQAYFRPDEPVVLALQANSEDDEVLRGAVPQQHDWLRSWRAARSRSSFSALAGHAATEHFAAQIRPRAVQRRAYQSMLRIMREVIRARKRQWIREATNISLSFDDRRGYQLLMFRCDRPLHQRGAEGDLSEPVQEFARSGILGCLDTVRGTSMEEFEEDYAVRLCGKILELVDIFATPLGEAEPDAVVRRQLREATRSIVVDGALQKAAQLLKSKGMPNIILVCRDPAHMVRIACAEPLNRSRRFEAQHSRLFTSQHALLKNFQYSTCWRARLAACQKIVVQADGTQGGDITHILRHFSYAPHRWESLAGPRRHYVCLLNAIFMCLGSIANDSRQTADVRQRAEHCMDCMSARDILEAGLAGDFSEVCMRFSRKSRTLVGGPLAPWGGWK